ncbi:MAG: NADH-quinone oxidoreductase subunit D [Candidatus Coatesbacteria bacterium]|nr:MAG: NADH-quinone oxidoreductase subunit D [Candidatus Coatesbacteria bacterium]HDM59990.1 NADH-quinone oxidoreductase subunit D [Bacillota bacterium]
MRELELYFGPQHLGMVGNFSITLKVEGDRILEAAANPGYLHRGFEKLMEYRTWIQNFPLVCRVNVIEPDHIEMIYAMAVEKLAQIEVPERAHFVRSIYLELARVGSHLFGLWAYANMLGFDTVAQWAMYHRDLVLDLFEELTGGRVYHIYIWPGGVRRDFPPGFTDRIVHTLHSIGGCVPDYNSTFFDNRLFYERAKGIGQLTQQQAKEWGATGQTLRATGMKYDIRKVEPYAAYDKVDWEVPTRKDGDAYSRILVIRDEMIESVHMIFKLLDAMPEGPVYTRMPNPFKWKVPKGEAYVRCESSRGELGLYLVSNGGDKPYRVHFRTPSYPHGLIVLEKLLRNASIADVGNIMISLYVVAPEIDR